MSKLLASSIFAGEIEEVLRKDITKEDSCLVAENKSRKTIIYKIEVSFSNSANPVCTIVKC